MSTGQLRSEIDNYLNKIDEPFLRVVHSMLDTYHKELQVKAESIIGYTIDGEPKFASESKPIYDERVRAAKEEGRFISLEDAEEEIASW